MQKIHNLSKNQKIIFDLIDKSGGPMKAYSILFNVQKSDYTLFVACSNDSFETEKKLVDQYLNLNVDAIFISITHDTKSFDHLEAVKERNKILVMFDKNEKTFQCPKVMIDDRKAGFLATEHLIKRGCKQILHFRGAYQPHITIDRFLGMIQGRVGPELTNILIKQDEVAKYVAKKLGVPEELIRSTEEMQAAAQQMQQMLQANPNNQELINQANALTNKINARKAILIAEMTKDYMMEEQKILTEYGGDPLLKLKSRELDIKARADEAKRAYDEGRISLDTMRAMQNQQQFDEKMEQNEDLAELRADTSLTKQEMSIASKKFDFGRNFKKN